jgi:hypothetical protein
MSKVMLTLQLDPADANVAAVSRKLNLSPDAIDSEFGVVNISPKDNLYTILVDEAVGARLKATEGVSGPYSNPRIEPFGPPTR